MTGLPLYAALVAALCVGVAAGVGIGRTRPLRRARAWAVSYFLTVTPETASSPRTFAAATLIPDWIVKGHRSLRASARREQEDSNG